jgi:NAD(P)-dependent dehydrogenase (short-subunit alcohol dehydrogenase family)
MVTGATGALGHEIAMGLARRGASVVLLCRDSSKGQALQADVRRATGNESVDLLLADLSVMGSVREAARTFLTRHDRLHVLVNNAATFVRRRALTPDRLETMFAANYLGPFLLTNLLVPALKADPPSRVIVVSAPSTTKLEFDDLQGEKRFGALHAFGASKAADLLFTYELARRLEGTCVTANVLHPGLMKSNLMRQAPAPIRWMAGVASKPPEKAAEVVLHLASSPEVLGQTGRFFKGVKRSDSSPYSRDLAVQRRLWDVSERLVGETFPHR